MADKKISALTAATTPLGGTEVFPIVQSSTTVKATIANVQAAPVSAGTANGVQFLDGSKVPTTSTRLTFDGSQIFKNSGGFIQYNDVSGTGAAGTRMAGGGTLGTDSFDLFQNGAGGYIINRGATPLNIGTNNINSQIVLDTSGNATIATGNLVIGTSGKGIDFSATPGTGTSELLADYEEGTWTPTQGAGLTVVGAFSSSGTYTKVGRMVTVRGLLNGATSIAAVAGTAMCGALPFTPSGSGLGTAVDNNAASGCVLFVSTGGSLLSASNVTASPAIGFGATYFV